MRNPITKFRKKCMTSKKPGYLPKKLKTLMNFNYHKVWYFLLKFCTRLLLSNV